MIAEGYKQCRECKGVLEATEANFHRYKQASTGEYGLRALCRSCHNKRKRQYTYERKPLPKKDTKKCRSCKQIKPLSEYSFRTAMLKGGEKRYYVAKCKYCKSIEVQACKLERKLKKERKEGKGTIDQKWLVRGTISNSNRTTMVEN